MSSRNLEREVTKVSPQADQPERVRFILDKNDPQEAAKRAALRAQKKTEDKKSDVTGQIKAQAQPIKRKPLPAELEHQVHLRDGSQCTYYDSKGRRCGQRRWLHIHHLNPLSQGGQDTLENIVILCSGHHSIIHAGMNAQHPKASVTT